MISAPHQRGGPTPEDRSTPPKNNIPALATNTPAAIGTKSKRRLPVQKSFLVSICITRPARSTAMPPKDSEEAIKTLSLAPSLSLCRTFRHTISTSVASTPTSSNTIPRGTIPGCHGPLSGWRKRTNGKPAQRIRATKVHPRINHWIIITSSPT
jgi:hypothetical protein